MAFARILLKTLLGLFILLLLVGVMLPDSVRIERQIQIKASPEHIFPSLNNLQSFHQWSPWSEITHNQYTFSGPAAGVGSRMAWRTQAAEKNQGDMEIILSEPNQQVQSKLDFGGKGGGITSFILSPGQSFEHTQLLWRFDADFGWDLYGRYIGLLLDKMIGSSYEQGLKNLKQRIESERQ
jgi:carbon monoxide dehydrogenase subunit G